jgi:hypothetical protein
MYNVSRDSVNLKHELLLALTSTAADQLIA